MQIHFRKTRDKLCNAAKAAGTFVLVAALIWKGEALAQEYMFTTLAGSGGPGAVDGPAAEARFNNPQSVALDSVGNIYVADSLNATVRKIATNGVVTTVAGLAASRGIADGIGGMARFNLPAALVLDREGNILVADQYSHTIRKISPGGVVTTLAGVAGRSGSEDGIGSAARFSFPSGLAIDQTGNLYVADQANHSIRKVSPAGEVATLAGSASENGTDDGQGVQARFSYPTGIAVGNGGIVYVADSDNHTIRKITADGMVTTFAGSPRETGSADGTGSDARFYNPIGLATDSAGNLYVADTLNSTIRKVTPEGVVTTLAGDPTQPDVAARPFVSYVDGTGPDARFKYPYGVAADTSGNVFVADTGNDSIRRIAPGNVVSTVAGSAQPGSSDGAANIARFSHPSGVAVNGAGEVFVVDGVNNTVRRIESGGTVTTLAGSPGESGSTDGIGKVARFNGPRKLGLDSKGNLFVADTANHTIRKMSPVNGTASWEVTTFAGRAENPGSADGPGNVARFNALYDVALDPADNMYVADKDNQVIRKVTPDGTVTTFAGMLGVAGWADGPGESAQFKVPYGIAVDRSGFVYVADTLNHTIRKISPEGFVSTLAGEADSPGNDDGVGNFARFYAPYGVAVDGATNVYVADYFNNLIRKITPDGTVMTLGGSVVAGPDGYPLFGSADGLGPSARFYNPKGIAVDSGGTIYIADSFNNAIRVGTTNFCLDEAKIDRAVALVGEQRQLETAPQTAVGWEWTLIRRPARSQATLSATNVRNPTFTPDVADVFVFQLHATNSAGATCVRTVTLLATPPGPTIVASSVVYTNSQFHLTFQGSPGAAVQVQLSGDLTNWVTLGTVTNSTGTSSFFDPFPDPQRRFYRLREM